MRSCSRHVFEYITPFFCCQEVFLKKYTFWESYFFPTAFPAVFFMSFHPSGTVILSLSPRGEILHFCRKLITFGAKFLGICPYVRANADRTRDSTRVRQWRACGTPKGVAYAIGTTTPPQSRLRLDSSPSRGRQENAVMFRLRST